MSFSEQKERDYGVFEMKSQVGYLPYAVLIALINEYEETICICMKNM